MIKSDLYIFDINTGSMTLSMCRLKKKQVKTEEFQGLGLLRNSSDRNVNGKYWE